MPQKRLNYIPENSSALQEKFINSIMREGKKNLARKIFNESLLMVSSKVQKDPIEIFEKAIENVKPNLEVKAKRIGGAVYQIPMEVRPDRQITLSMRWILKASRDKKGQSMAKKLADELIAAANEEGSAIKKREDVIKMAHANKAFAHYAKY